MTIRTSSIALALAVSAFAPALASADDVTYPPGTNCANLPTLSARLVCGRQELRRDDPASRENVTPPPYDGYSPDPEQAQPPPGLVPAPTVAPTPLGGGDPNAVHPE